METYSPKDVSLNIGGYIISGYADGTFITFERDVDAYTKVVGADGEVARSRSGNRSGRLTLTLMQTSNSNAVLGALQLLDEADDSGTFDVLLKDNLGYEHFGGIGWIVKPPSGEYGSEMSNREWAIDVDNLIHEFPT